MKGIAIGQYYPEESYIHRLDPRFKLLATIIYIITLFFVKTLWAYVIPVAYLLMVIYASKVPFKLIIKGLRGIFFVIIFTVIINIFMTPGDTQLFKLWIFTATAEGVYHAIMIGLRLVFLVMGSSILTLTTSPIQLTDGIEYLLAPFKKIGVPAHDIAMMMTISLRYIPTLLEETDKIMKAQTARGADFDTGGLVKKAKSMIPLLVPLFISAFRRADDLALAMEARCYNGDTHLRTKLKVLKLSALDYYGMLFYIVYVFLLIFTRFYLR